MQKLRLSMKKREAAAEAVDDMDEVVESDMKEETEA